MAIGAVLAGAAAGHAASTRLNPPLVPGGLVGAFAVAPNSSRVVYRAIQDTAGVTELYGVAIAGGPATRLNGPLTAGGAVSTSAGGFVISPDSSRVVYIADQDTDGVNEIYSAALGGGDVTKLNPPLTAGGNVSPFFRVSPDGSRVVYIADQDTDGVNELYSVPIGGGPAIKLNPPLGAGRSVQFALISPDGSRVVYSAQQDANTVTELYSVPITGGAAAKLNAPLAPGANVTSFNIAASGAVVFVVDPAQQNVSSMVELYSAPLAGGPPTLLNVKVIKPGVILFAITFALSPDGSRVVYTAAANDGTWLYSSPIAGGAPAKLNDDPRTIGGVGVTVAVVSPDSSRVVYPAGGELYSVPLAGGPVTKLSGPMVSGGSVSTGFSFGVSPNSSRVVYRADQDTDNVTELYSVPLAGGPVTKLNGPLTAGGNVASFVFTPDGHRVVYRADQDTDGVNELYGVSLTGGAATKLNGPLVGGGTVSSTFSVSPDSQRVVYIASQDTANVQELYSAPLIGAATAIVAAVLPAGRSVQVGAAATVFATIINAGPNAGQLCAVGFISEVFAGAVAVAGPGPLPAAVVAGFAYQTTDPLTNALIGTPNTPVDIAAGASQSFVLEVTPAAPTPPVDLAFVFQCANSAGAPVIVGLNTLLLSASTTPTPDIIALASTPSGDGVVNMPGPNGTGVFAVATANVGAGAAITVTADTGGTALAGPGSLLAPGATLPVALSLCQTDPATAACVNPPVPAESVTTEIGPGETPTFSVFVQGQGVVGFDPANNRVFVRFKDDGGLTRGATSVAVRTQ